MTKHIKYEMLLGLEDLLWNGNATILNDLRSDDDKGSHRVVEFRATTFEYTLYYLNGELYKVKQDDVILIEIK
jgi:hypothetical protein